MPLMPGGGDRQYRAPGAGLPGAPLPLPSPLSSSPTSSSPTMMSMNSKQAFSMHPILHEPKYPHLHTSSEAIRRACLPAPQVSRAPFEGVPHPRRALPNFTSAARGIPSGFGEGFFFGGGGVLASSRVGWGWLSVPSGMLGAGRGAGGTRGKRWRVPPGLAESSRRAQRRLCGTPAGSPRPCGCSLFFWGRSPRRDGWVPGVRHPLLGPFYLAGRKRVGLGSSYLSQALLEGQSGTAVALLFL